MFVCSFTEIHLPFHLIFPLILHRANLARVQLFLLNFNLIHFRCIAQQISLSGDEGWYKHGLSVPIGPQPEPDSAKKCGETHFRECVMSFLVIPAALQVQISASVEGNTNRRTAGGDDGQVKQNRKMYAHASECRNTVIQTCYVHILL